MLRMSTFLIFVFLFTFTGCGDKDTCASGSTQKCDCVGGGQGAQVCADDGKKWGECKGCSSKPDSGADSAKPDTAAPDAPRPDALQPDAAIVAPGKWVTVPSGKFTMGSPATEKCRGTTETQHVVTLTNKFEIQNTEVTQGQYKAFMGYNPSLYATCGNNCPVEHVNWHQAAAYCNELSKKKGKTQCYLCTGKGKEITCQETNSTKGSGIYGCTGYRLPTEAEWEYAYRAGTTKAFYNGDISACSGKETTLEKIAWYKSNAGGQTNPVAKKTANAWGVYDLAGNVYEWCHDLDQKDLGAKPVTDPVGSGSAFRMTRGGSWDSPASYHRAAYRNHGGVAKNRFANVGFRCVRTLP